MIDVRSMISVWVRNWGFAGFKWLIQIAVRWSDELNEELAERPGLRHRSCDAGSQPMMHTFLDIGPCSSELVETETHK
jgi:hypothetical protein